MKTWNDHSLESFLSQTRRAEARIHELVIDSAIDMDLKEDKEFRDKAGELLKVFNDFLSYVRNKSIELTKLSNETKGGEDE